VNEAELSTVPLEARPYQGATAGVFTRVVANTVDALVVTASLIGGYACYAAFRFIVSPRDFRMPAPSLLGVEIAFFSFLVVYLTAAWWIGGRTLGNHVMGIRVVRRGAGRVPLVRAFARAVLCAGFPVGLLWCAVDGRRRSVQDLVLRTRVVYDWRSRSGGASLP
jgi:uncharacterized RDD family membrane protein YckC